MASIPLLSGAVVSERTLASEIGTKMLELGGNAADAMIATVLAVNTLCMYHSDLGGGGFCIIREPSGKYASLDFRQSAPKAITMEYFKNRSTSVGGAAVAVPGHVRGLEEIHKKHGRLPWKRLFEESIALASDGQEYRGDLNSFVVRELNPPYSTNIKDSWMEKDPEYAPFFDAGTGEVIPQGSNFKRPEYARTLSLLAEGGADAFYQGEIAEGITKAVQAREGLMTLEDLRDYRPRWNTPLSAKYRDHTLWTIPAPASGAIWLSAMGTLSHFQPEGEGSVTDLHRLTEALRLAYGQRTRLGDPSYVTGLDKAQREWISPESTKTRAGMIDDSKTFPPDYYKPPGVEIKEDNGTSNITTADSDGLVLSMTTTVGLGFGSHIIVPGYGFVLNDSMDDFSVAGRANGTGYEPSPANYVDGGRRPLSSSCPYIVENAEGQVVLAGGAAGGSTIISCNTQVARNVLDYGMTASEALRANRLHNQIVPNVSQLERSTTHQGITVDGFSEAQAEALQQKGHAIEWVPANRSTPCAMTFLPGPDWEPAGDPRKYESGGSVFHA